MLWYADLSDADVKKIKTLEKEMGGKVLLAYKKALYPAKLTDEQVKKIQKLEKELGALVVVYE
ncbi:MAG: hypothetical protein ACFFCD_07880 [Promethearchaeota archaeon]